MKKIRCLAAILASLLVMTCFTGCFGIIGALVGVEVIIHNDTATECTIYYTDFDEDYNYSSNEDREFKQKIKIGPDSTVTIYAEMNTTIKLQQDLYSRRVQVYSLPMEIYCSEYFYQ